MAHFVRKALLAATGIAGLVFMYGRYIERSRVKLDRFTVEVDRPGLPPQGVTILHLSDLHVRAAERVQAVKLAQLRRLLADEQYDILAMTGDLIHNMAGLPTAAAFLAELKPRLAAFFVPGNRDYLESSFRALFGTPEERHGLSKSEQVVLAVRKVRRVLHRFMSNKSGAGESSGALALRTNDVNALLGALAAQGIQPLVNRNVHLTANGLDLWIAGIDDLGNGSADLGAALDGVPENAPLILLSHNPDVWLWPLAAPADLILSGHTHGGQIRMPVLGAVYRQGTHLGRRDAAGWFERGRKRLFISRGLGESFPLRLGAPLQVALIRLLPGAQSPAPETRLLAENGLPQHAFTLRAVGTADMDALLELYRQCEDFLALGPQPHASREMVLADLALSQPEGGSFYGIYLADGRLAGVVDFTPEGRREHPEEGHIALLMLAQPFRNCGLGAAVVRSIEATMWGSGKVRAIAAEAQVNNPDALRFWQRMKYRVTGGPYPQPDGTISWYLRKERA